MGWVEEELLWSRGEHDVRLPHVESDVAPAWALGPQCFGEGLRCVEGISEDEAPPAAVDRGIGPRRALDLARKPAIFLGL